MEKAKVNVTDEFAILSSIWILASNDENPIMTYEGISHRLGVNNTPRVKKLITAHQELFRLFVSPMQLDEWKGDMLKGDRLPGWLREMDKGIRNVKINDLTREDVFRSQFRVEKNASKTPIEVIQWGLEHIDRLRKANVERKTTIIKVFEILLPSLLGAANLALLIYQYSQLVK